MLYVLKKKKYIINKNDFSSPTKKKYIKYSIGLNYILINNTVFTRHKKDWIKNNNMQITKNITMVWYIERYLNYNKDIKIIYINNIIFGFKYNKKNEILLYLQNPQLYIINKICNPKNLKYFKFSSLNNVYGLNKLNDIPNINDLYITAKLDGITAIIAVIKGYGIYCIDMQSNCLYIDKTYKNIDKTSIFYGEYINNMFYLYLQINNKTFQDDYNNILKFIKKYNKFNIININIIKFGEKNIKTTLKYVINDLIKFKLKTDGFIFGSIEYKHHIKWKPINLITNDFYIIIDNKYIYLYVSSIINNNIRRNLKKKRNDNNSSIKNIIKYKTPKYGWIFFYKQKKNNDWLPEYNNNIIECLYNNQNYIPIKQRIDRDYPNNINTVLKNNKMIEYPITFSDLINYK